MSARFVSFSTRRQSSVIALATSWGLAALACGEDVNRREFGDAWVPPAETLGNVSGAQGEDDGAADDGGASEGQGPVSEDGTDDGAAADDAPDPDAGGMDGPVTDDGAVGESDDGSAVDEGGDDGPMQSPYVGGWDVGDCQDSIVSNGTSVGNVIPDFSLLDQNGDMVRLYDFCHKAVWLIEGAFW